MFFGRIEFSSKPFTKIEPGYTYITRLANGQKAFVRKKHSGKALSTKKQGQSKEDAASAKTKKKAKAEKDEGQQQPKGSKVYIDVIHGRDSSSPTSASASRSSSTSSRGTSTPRIEVRRPINQPLQGSPVHELADPAVQCHADHYLALDKALDDALDATQDPNHLRDNHNNVSASPLILHRQPGNTAAASTAAAETTGTKEENAMWDAGYDAWMVQRSPRVRFAD